MTHSPTQVLCIGGLDPAGCAGICADMAMINSLGGHASSVATTLTVQTETIASQSTAVANGLIAAQLRALLVESEYPPNSVKVGLVKDGRHWTAIARHLEQQALVIDPVLCASSGLNLAALDRRWKQGFKKIAARADLITPNTQEWALLQPLIPSSTAVLVTGKIEGATVVNELYQHGELLQQFSTPLIAGEYRGTGCRLASAIAFYLGSGKTLTDSIEAAMTALSQAIENAYGLGEARIPKMSQNPD